MNSERLVDQEWTEIMSTLKNPGEFNPDYPGKYLDGIKILIGNYEKLKSNGVSKEIINLLYDIGTLFYCFDIYMRKYNTYAYNHKLLGFQYEWIPTYDGIPGSHNYCAFLNKLNGTMLDKYYDRCIAAISGYVESNAKKLPEYLYTIAYGNKRKEYCITTHKLIRDIESKQTGLYNIPSYQSLSKDEYLNTAEEYRKYFKREDSFDRFVKYEWPVMEWVRDHCELIDPEEYPF